MLVDYVACLRHSLGVMATSGKVNPWSEPWAAIQTSQFMHFLESGTNLNPLRDSFCKPKFRTVPDVSGPVEGMPKRLAYSSVSLHLKGTWETQNHQTFCVSLVLVPFTLRPRKQNSLFLMNPRPHQFFETAPTKFIADQLLQDCGRSYLASSGAWLCS